MPVSETPASSPEIPRHLIAFIGALVAIGPLSLDAYLPAMPAMAEDFGVAIVKLNNTISIYLVGYGIGQFFGGALSDQIGRKRIGLIGLSIFALASILIANAETVGQVQWLRFTQAIGGGFSTVICMAIIRDVYPIEELGKRMAMMTLIMLASPIIAPTIGAMLLQFGWHAIFVFKAAYALTLALSYAFLVPETRPGAWANLSFGTTLSQCLAVIRRRTDSGLRPILYALAMGFGASAFLTFLTNSSFAYIQYFGVSESRFPIYFGLSIVGLIGTNIFAMKRLTSANAALFFRLGLGIQLASVASLLLFVFAGPKSIWLVVAPVAVMIASFGLTGPAGSAQYMSYFDKLAGSASSLYTTLMFALGAALGLVSGFFFDGTLRPMVVTMLCASITANVITAAISRPARSARG